MPGEVIEQIWLYISIQRGEKHPSANFWCNQGNQWHLIALLRFSLVGTSKQFSIQPPLNTMKKLNFIFFHFHIISMNFCSISYIFYWIDINCTCIIIHFFIMVPETAARNYACSINVTIGAGSQNHMHVCHKAEIAICCQMPLWLPGLVQNNFQHAESKFAKRLALWPLQAYKLSVLQLSWVCQQWCPQPTTTATCKTVQALKLAWSTTISGKKTQQTTEWWFVQCTCFNGGCLHPLKH